MATPSPDAKRGTVDLAILATLEHQARYGLEILATDIEDQSDNRTRFVIVKTPRR